MAGIEEQASFSPNEVGLLTVAERRGCVRVPRWIDERSEPAHLDRMAVLRRMIERGLMRERATTGDADLEFEMTEEGRKALETVDQPSGATDAEPPGP